MINYRLKETRASAVREPILHRKRKSEREKTIPLVLRNKVPKAAGNILFLLVTSSSTCVCCSQRVGIRENTNTVLWEFTHLEYLGIFFLFFFF